MIKGKKTIKIDNNRLRYTNKKLDITIIEIKENKDKLNNKYLDLDDSIINYFKSNENEDPNYLNDIYSNESIYIINYPKDKDIVVSYGKSPLLNESEIQHYCSTESGSSGTPILLINNQKLIGIHCTGYQMDEYNKGKLIIYSIIEFQKMNNNYLNKKDSNDNNKLDNYIIGEFIIKKRMKRKE